MKRSLLLLVVAAGGLFACNLVETKSKKKSSKEMSYSFVPSFLFTSCPMFTRSHSTKFWSDVPLKLSCFSFSLEPAIMLPLQQLSVMKNKILFIAFLFCALALSNFSARAQCSICTRTTQQLGEKPAKNLNAGILYLAAAPLMIVGFLGYRWWRQNSE